MKIEDNRALVVKRKLYNQPEVNIAQIGTMSIICASGSGGGPSFGPIDPDATTDIQL